MKKTCRNCGQSIELPKCIENCKLTNCKKFSGGYCFGSKNDCPYGVNGEHQIFIKVDY